ncbi:MAG: potassium/proton antiporter [Planctomycetia bacterium]|nr:potassium/proton antiporter [Planctomycetia bacterium]
MTLHLLAIGFFLFLGIVASKISSFLKVPILLIFLAIGMLAGIDGLGIPYDNFSHANYLGAIALAFILFSGGYDTRWSDVKTVLAPGTVLATVGVLLTAVLLGAFVCLYLKISIWWALLLGAVISSTDAAAVFALFRSRSFGLRGRLRPLLEYESGSNDPMAAFLTLFFISVLSYPDVPIWSIVPLFALRMSVGIVAGFLTAKCFCWLFDSLHLEYEGLYYVLGIAVVFLSFSLAELTMGNGFMAVYVCGLVMGNSKFVYKYGLARFSDGLAWLMQVAIFLVLGLLVTPSELVPIAWEGFVIGLVLMFLVRPLVILLCLPGRSFSLGEKALIAWGGFRGAAPIVLATFPMLAFAGTPEEQSAKVIFNIVFFIVISSIFIQGKTLMPLARLLKLDKYDKPRSRAPLEFEETGNTNDRMYEFEITAESKLVGMRIADLGLPAEVLILLIRRNGAFVIPSGPTVLCADDDLITFLDPIAIPEMEAILANGATRKKKDKGEPVEGAPSENASEPDTSLRGDRAC